VLCLHSYPMGQELNKEDAITSHNAVNMRWIGHVACMGDNRGAFRVLVGRPERRDHFEDPGIDEDSIKMDRQEVGWGCMDWIDLAEDRDR